MVIVLLVVTNGEVNPGPVQVKVGAPPPLLAVREIVCPAQIVTFLAVILGVKVGFTVTVADPAKLEQPFAVKVSEYVPVEVILETVGFGSVLAKDGPDHA